MAARTNKIRQDDQTRAKIQAAAIINRLHGHVMGKVELDAAQVSSAKILLSKVLPDLKALEVDANVQQNVISRTPVSMKDWAEQNLGDD